MRCTYKEKKLRLSKFMSDITRLVVLTGVAIYGLKYIAGITVETVFLSNEVNYNWWCITPLYFRIA